MLELAQKEPERQVAGTCAACGEPIYAGELIRTDEGHMLHNDTICLTEWIKSNWPVLEICEAIGIGEEVA